MGIVDRAGLRADITLAWGRPERDVRVAADDLESLLDALDAAERERDAVQQQFEAAMAGLGELNQHHGVGEVGAILRRTFQAIAAVPIPQDAPVDPAVSR